MQPTPPRVNPRSSFGPGVIFGVIALLAVVYLADHAGKGEVAVFGGVNRNISELDFRGAQCTAVFGGCKIDLRNAKIEGREAVFNAYAIFGGVSILVPEDWEIVKRNVAIFGGTSDHTRRLPKGPETKTLIIDGVVMFGGLDVRN